MNSPWHYHAYDLHIVSDFELPELAPWPPAVADARDPFGAPDVTIVLGATLERAALEGAQQLQWGERHWCLWFQVARFTVSDGARVTVEPVEGYGAAAWRVPLLGSALAALLEQRELFALHAGALIFETGAAAFLGDKGQGKSTLNAALSHAGFPLLNDDVTALQLPADPMGAPWALPGFSQIKLLPDAVRAATGTAPEQWPIVAPEIAEFDKRAFRASLAQRGAPLRAIFVLHWAPDQTAPDATAPDATAPDQTAPDATAPDETATNATAPDATAPDATAPDATAPDQTATNANIEADAKPAANGLRLRRLSAQEALAQLIPHTFGARFGAGYLEGARRKTHFLCCARLVSACPVWELTRPRDLALLSATIALIARVMDEEFAA